MAANLSGLSRWVYTILAQLSPHVLQQPDLCLPPGQLHTKTLLLGTSVPDSYSQGARCLVQEKGGRCGAA